MDKDKLYKEIDELKKQKADFQKKISEIQQQIDSKVLELESVQNLKNKYIYIIEMRCLTVMYIC